MMCLHLGFVWEFRGEWNRMECINYKGMEQNGMEWNEFNEWNGMEQNRMEWNEMKLNNLVWMF